jgi:hypothetical protein
LFFAFMALIALTTTLAACGGGGGGGGNGNEDPNKVIDEATLQGINSGNLELSLDVKAQGSEGGNLNISLSGPFESQSEGSMPRLDLTASASGSINGEDINFNGGLTLLPDTAYVGYEGTEYEVDPTTFSFVQQAIKRAQQQGGEGKESKGCQEAASELKVSDFINNLSNEGSADVGGASTTKVSGDLDLSGAIDTLVGLVENPACAAQLSSSPLPSASELEQAKGQINSAVKNAHVDVYVGEDHIVRRVSAQLTIEPPKGSGEGPESAELNLELSLTGVNEEQQISAPQGAKPLNKLFLKLGVNPIELAGALSGEGEGEGLGNLLEGLGGGSGGSSGSGGGSAPMHMEPESAPNEANQQAYLKCVGEASTPVDLQKCVSLLHK